MFEPVYAMATTTPDTLTSDTCLIVLQNGRVWWRGCDIGEMDITRPRVRGENPKFRMIIGAEVVMFGNLNYPERNTFEFGGETLTTVNFRAAHFNAHTMELRVA